MVYSSVAADPFSILTVVVAPAVLTNASSVVCGCVLMIRETQLAVKGLAYDATFHIG